MSYKVKLVETKDLLIQLEAIKSSLKDLLNDLLDGTKGFNYQITLTFVFKKMQKHWNWVFSSLFQFNSKNSDKS